MVDYHSAFRRIGLSPIVEISEAARIAAPEYEKRTGEPFIYFQRGEVGMDTPAYIKAALMEGLCLGLTKYPKSGGEPWFKKAVLSYLDDQCLDGYGPEHVVCTMGGQEGLELAFNLFRGSAVAGFTPVWPCMLENIWPYTECQFVPVPLLDYKIDFELLEKTLKEVQVFYLNSPHNPTGTVFEDEDLFKLSEMCRKNNVILISDEAYNDLVFEGHWFSMLEFNANHIICCFTFSKSFAATGLRVGYTVSKNPAIISHMVRGEYTQTAGVPTPIQWAFAEALNNKEKREEWFAWYRGEMRKRRDALCETISPEFRPSNPAGAFYTFVDFNSFILEGVDKDYHISKLLMENGIAVVPGSAFGEGYEGFARLSFSTMTPAVIRNGCARLNSLFLK